MDHTQRHKPTSIERVAEEQRRRRMALREETERHRALLKEHLAGFEDATAVRTTMASSTTVPIAGSGADRHSPQHHGKFLGAVAAAPHRSSASLELELLEKQVAESAEENSRRLRAAEQKKRELLVRMAQAQSNEAVLLEKRTALASREEALRSKQQALHERRREFDHQQSVLDADYMERKALHEAAIREAGRRKKEDERALIRQQTQVHEMEERLRGLEMQLIVKAHAIDEAERDVARQAAKLRAEELRAIESLRKSIEAKTAV